MKPTEQQLIEKATLLFKKYGFKSISMDDLSKSLKISKKTLYKYFANKEDLIAECFVSIFKEHRLKRDAILEKKISAIQKIILLYRYGLKHLAGYAPGFYFELKKYYPEIYYYYTEAREGVILNTIKSLLEQAQAEGKILKEMDVALFCELHLYKIDTMLSDQKLTTKYSLTKILNHLVVYNIRGVLQNEEQI